MGGVLNQNDSVFDKRLDTRVHKNDKYPMTTYFCGGSQGQNQNENKLYVMKWTEMEKTLYDDVVPEDNSEDDQDDIIEKMNNIPKEPVIKFESIPHRGVVNRLRSLHGTGIVATWNDEGDVGIYNVQSAIDQLDADPTKDDTPKVDTTGMTPNQKKKLKKKVNAAKKVNYGGVKIANFKHKQEGYAIEWSPNTFGRLASGSCDAHLWIYAPADENCSSFIKES
jgi:ribosome assembly protein RRB1